MYVNQTIARSAIGLEINPKKDQSTEDQRSRKQDAITLNAFGGDRHAYEPSGGATGVHGETYLQENAFLPLPPQKK